MIDHAALEFPVQGQIRRVEIPADLEEMLTALRRSRIVGYDIETNGLDPYTSYVRTLQFATATDAPIWVLDLFDWGDWGFAAPDENPLNLTHNGGLAPLVEFLASGRSLVIAHNADFEYRFTRVHLGVDIPRLYCTRQAEKLLNQGRWSAKEDKNRVSLAACMERRYGLGVDKTLQLSFGSGEPLTDAQYEYAAIDAWAVLHLYRDQLEEIKAADLLRVMQLEAKVTRVLAQASLRGVPFDVEQRRAALVPTQARLYDLENSLTEVLGELYDEYRHDKYNEKYDHWAGVQAEIDEGLANGTLTKGSPEIQALYKQRGGKPKPLAPTLNMNSNPVMLEMFRRAGVELPNLQAETVTELRDKHPALELMAQVSEIKNDVKNFGDGLIAKINPVTGRIHGEFNQILNTGRASMRNPTVQNWPPHVRECVKAPEGRTLIAADFNNLELRVLAGLSQDAGMLRAFAEGKDLHCATASDLSEFDYETVLKAHESKDKAHPAYELRQLAKTVNFGIAFGQTPYGLHMTTGKPLDECETFITRWKEVRPGAWEFLCDRAEFAQINGYAVTHLGRKRWFPALPIERGHYDREYRKALKSLRNEGQNTPVQGTAADIAKRALVLINDQFERVGIDGGIINFVHDEVVCEVSKGQADMAAQIVEACMREAGRETFNGSPEILAEAVITLYWTH